MLLCFAALTPQSQERVGLLVKTNILNALAKRPAISVEKTFKDKYGLELSYTTGELNCGAEIISLKVSYCGLKSMLMILKPIT